MRSSDTSLPSLILSPTRAVESNLTAPTTLAPEADISANPPIVSFMPVETDEEAPVCVCTMAVEAAPAATEDDDVWQMMMASMHVLPLPYLEAEPSMSSEEEAACTSLPLPASTLITVSAGAPDSPSSQEYDWLSSSAHSQKKEIKPKKKKGFASRLHMDVILAIDVCLHSEGSTVNAGEVASWLGGANQYQVSVRSGLSGGAAPSSQLGHEFLLVHGAEDAEGTDFIVDLHFKELMTIPQPSER